MYRSNREFNYARKAAFNALSYCIEKCFYKKGVTEKAFSELWIKEIQQDNDIIENGWYCPPPMGIAVLSGSTKHPSRINYDSLRNPEFWPQDREINWYEDLFYVYYSPLSVKSNRPGDISVTLYFGDDAGIREHFKKTHAVTVEILKGIEVCNSSVDLFSLYLNLLNENGLLGCGLSSTDPALTNIGHTLPIIDLNGENSLSDNQRKEISNARRFINGVTSWTFDEDMQFTVEPQLMSSLNPELPQISYHYLACKKNAKINVCDDVDILLNKFDLI